MTQATDIHVRPTLDGEQDALGRIMFRAIHEGHSAYTPAQRSAWCAEPPAGAPWAARLTPMTVRVAEANGAPIGFMARQETYVDFTFVLPDWQGRGVFSALFARAEADARAEGLRRLWVHASLMAQPAFAAQGFRVIRHETVPRNGETLDRAEMEKVLT
ncbi:GNAT family N-acetyltransferase [uncultured Tateyamaria sp.]|uniref:GNAT family N-acetyltransferase n=1 Tax=uncultured Tateyamaria sp. TaxID=455651 RepID=UPI00261FD046|nr:GNAT family N-acetyltransferase [uncultured Tateyamaria sp.]